MYCSSYVSDLEYLLSFLQNHGLTEDNLCMLNINRRCRVFGGKKRCFNSSGVPIYFENYDTVMALCVDNQKLKDELGFGKANLVSPILKPFVAVQNKVPIVMAIHLSSLK